MLRIRLRRTGARKKPQYRLVIAESTSPRDGHFIEIIGTYNPLTDPSTLNVKADRATHWLSVGATPSDRVHKLLAREGLMAPFKFKEKPGEGAQTGTDSEPVSDAEATDAPPTAPASASASGEADGAEASASGDSDAAATPDAASEAV